jgi:fructokinase
LNARERGGIACFGEALIDFLADPPGGDDAVRRFARHAGGAPANVAVGVARLGGDARFVGMLGEDMFGRFLLGQLQRHGVDTSQLRWTGAAPTALAFVSLDEAGERSFSFYRPPAADLMFRAGDFDAAAFGSLTAFHCCSNSMTDPAAAAATLHGMALADEAGALVSFDLNLRPALWPAGMDPRPVAWQALERAQLVKLSREELDWLARDGGEDAVLARLFANAARVVLATDGAGPIRWWTRTRRGDAPTFRVDVVDTTAAGDAFVAGLLHHVAAHGRDPQALAAAFDDDLQRAGLLRHAAACGALATTRYGAFCAMPNRADVAALLAEAA